MPLQKLAKRLSDPARIGLNADLFQKLKLKEEDATRANLMAHEDDDHGHLGVYLLGAYVVDDTDTWGDGEIYWWSIPAFVDKKGKGTYEPIRGIPTGGAPHKCGSLEWMTNLSLYDPPLLTVIPPDDELASCVLRMGFYDDDGDPADMPKAMTAGLEALAQVSRQPLSGADQVITPVREAIIGSLKAQDDDILLDQDVTLRRGEATRFAAGFVGSEVNSMVRVYYLVKDERRTEQLGPIVMHKGQVETLKFKSRLAAGGRLSLFARGQDVNTTAFGNLTTDVPFVNRVLEAHTAATLEAGFALNGTGAAKVVAFYTPP